MHRKNPNYYVCLYFIISVSLVFSLSVLTFITSIRYMILFFFCLSVLFPFIFFLYHLFCLLDFSFISFFYPSFI